MSLVCGLHDDKGCTYGQSTDSPEGVENGWDEFGAVDWVPEWWLWPEKQVLFEKSLKVPLLRSALNSTCDALSIFEVGLLETQQKHNKHNNATGQRNLCLERLSK